ncbi:MAG: sigma-70 family RNA polymerase sigma factor [Gemmataceae bacterium]|nr:sigma-70 family RNA polymerase sigma factor [Gemmataceae bacterium]MCI0737975.1 sigma-70 family RNA polymerase sigma factor [Gemmataceae bacterium]
MAVAVQRDLLGRLRGTLSRREVHSDAQLLSWYLAAREEGAFRAIVDRYGSMVFGVCRRVLGDAHDAEDAFQAVFLVLLRKAASIVPRDNLGSWLYGVAYRTAQKAKSQKARRKAGELSAPVSHATSNGDQDSSFELRPILDRELAAMPEYYRLPILLCDLEGKSRKDAARQLRCNEGTLSGRLSRGRKLLAQRLTRQGLTLSVASLAALLSRQALADGPPATLVSATMKAAAALTIGNLGAVSAPVARLMREVLQTMLVSKLKSFAPILLLAFLGLALVVGQVISGQAAPGAFPPGKSAAVFPGKQKEKEVSGKIYFHKGLDFTIYDPHKKEFADFDALDEDYRKNYQSRSARLSPDGKQLAFGQAELRNAGGFPPSRIQLRKVGENVAPIELVSIPEKELSNWIWSPDGKKMSFAVWEEGDGKYHQWMVDVATGETYKVELPELEGKAPEGFGSLIHAWCPDGSWIVFAKGHFHEVNPITKKSRQLHEETTGFMSGSVRVSPDGKKLLYLGATKDNDWTLRVLEMRSGKTTVLATMENKADVSACWSPDNRQIVCSLADANDEGRPAGNFRVEIFTVGSEQPPTLLLEQERWLIVTDWRK